MERQYNVVATFDNSRKAEAVLDRLLARGIGTDEVTVLVADRARGRHFAIDAKHKFPEGAAVGGLIGAVIGALVAGISAAVGVAIPGLEAITAGIVIASLAGAGAGGLLGWLIGGLAGLGFDQHEAKLVEDEAKDGHIVVGVRADTEAKADVAEQVFEQGGATSVAS